MVDRSVKVVISGDVSNYVSAVTKGAEATKKIATAANEVKARIEAVTSAVAPLEAKLTGLGRNPGLTSLARDIGKVGTALHGLSGLTELGRLGTDLRNMGSLSLTTSVEEIRKLATAIQRITTATTSTTGLRDFATAMHGMASIGSGTASTEITAMASGIRRLVTTANSVPALRALATALRDLGAAGGGLGNLGNVGAGLRGLQSQIDALRRSVAGLNTAGGSGSGSGSGGLLSRITGGGGGLGQLAGMAVGYLAVGSAIKSTFKQTADFETQIATFGAVTHSVGQPLKDAAAEALALGADATIAGASASDAAQTLTELAKGGLSVQDSFAAAKGTLQLASAAVVDFSTAAGIQTAAINSFGLSASDAGMVADTLANTASAASGEITDFAEGMKQSGTVAHGFGVSLLENQTVLAQFANAGIKGSLAGNIFKSALLTLEKASGPSGKAIKELGITVKDSSGNYITAAKLEGQLSDAKKRLGTTAFNTAAAVAFGTRGVIFAGVAAQAGADGFNSLEGKIQGGAGAAALSAAKMSGLGGAILNMQNQAETAQVVIGEKLSPMVQDLANKISAAIPKVTEFLTGGDLAGGASKFGTFFKPLLDGAGALMSSAWPSIKSFFDSVGKGFQSVIGFVKPVIDAIGNFWKKASDNGSVARIGSVLSAIGDGFKNVAKWLAPVGGAIAGVIKWVGGLGSFGTTAGTAILALMGFKLVWPMLRGVLGIVPGFNAGARSITSFAASYRALTSTGIGRFPAILGAGVQGLANFGKGLLGAFGGPIGLAVIGITTAISFFTKANQDAKQATADTVAEIADLGTTVDATTGKLTKATGAKIFANWQGKGLIADFTGIGTGADEASASIVAGGVVMDQYKAKIVASGAAVKWMADQQNSSYNSGSALNSYAEKAKISYTDVAKAAIMGGDSATAMIAKLVAAGNDSGRVTDNMKSFGEAAAGLGGNIADSIPALADWTTEVNNSGQASSDAAAQYKAAQVTAALLANAWANAPGFIQAGQDVDKVGRVTAGAFATAAAAAKAARPEVTAAAAAIAAAAAAFNPLVDGLRTATDSVTGAAGKYGDFGTSLVTVKKAADGTLTAVTPLSTAYANYQTQATEAAAETDLFLYAMQRLSQKGTATAQQAIDGQAASVRALGASFRDQAANTDAVATAQDALTAAQGKATDENYSGKQKALDVAAAQRGVAAANDTAAASYANERDKITGLQGTTAALITSTANAANKTGGYTAAQKAALATMTQTRAAFIQQTATMGNTQVATAASTAAATKLADQYGFIATMGNITTILDADPGLAEEHTKDLATKLKAIADHKLAIKFGVDLTDAVTKYNQWNGAIGKMPKDVRTKFNADIAEAETHGKELFKVYDATTNTWTAQFETKGDAQAQANAGAVVSQYNLAKGTWSASFTADTSQAVAQYDLLTGAANAAIGAASAAATKAGIPQGKTFISQAAADGAIITAGTGPRADDVHVMVSKGEAIIPAPAVAKHPDVIAGMISGKFADGGIAGSKPNLAGIAAIAPGNIGALVVQALTDIASAVTAARTAATDKAQLAADAASHLKDAKGGLTDAKAKQSADIKAKASKAQLTQDATAVHGAQQTVDASTKAHDAAVKLAIAYDKSATAGAKAQKGLQGLYHAQQGYAAHLDQLTTQLGVASDNLASLKSDKASMSASIASTVSGYDGGITGHSDTRTDFASIEGGQKFDLAAQQKFARDLATLKKNGLNSTTLSQIASAGVDGGGVTAAGLAKASKGQIAQLNATSKAITATGNSVGNNVAGAFYDAGIAAATGLVKGLKSQMAAIQTVMSAIATTVVSTLTKKLKISSPSKVMRGHGVNTIAGYTEGIIASRPHVAAAMVGIVAAATPQAGRLPSIPRQNGGGDIGALVAAAVRAALSDWEFNQNDQATWKAVQRQTTSRGRRG